MFVLRLVKNIVVFLSFEKEFGGKDMKWFNYDIFEEAIRFVCVCVFVSVLGGVGGGPEPIEKDKGEVKEILCSERDMPFDRLLCFVFFIIQVFFFSFSDSFLLVMSVRAAKACRVILTRGAADTERLRR